MGAGNSEAQQFAALAQVAERSLGDLREPRVGDLSTHSLALPLHSLGLKSYSGLSSAFATVGQPLDRNLAGIPVREWVHSNTKPPRGEKQEPIPCHKSMKSANHLDFKRLQALQNWAEKT